MKKIFLFLLMLSLLAGCTHFNGFTHVGTGAVSYQSEDGKITVIIAKDEVLSDVIRILIEKGIIYAY